MSASSRSGIMEDNQKKSIAQAAASRYLQGNNGKSGANKWSFHFARNKFVRDPVYLGVLRHGLIRDHARLLDLGCGKALLESMLLHATEASLPADWPPAPRGLQLRGIEADADDVNIARAALGAAADIRGGDICSTEFPTSDLITLIDVLHYLPPAAQEEVLKRCHAALAPGGRLLLRVADAGAGLKFRWSHFIDKCVVFARSGKWRPLWGRQLDQWEMLLESLGFTVRRLPMSEGIGFANVLLVADRR